MGDDLDHFIEEQRTKLAQDKAAMEKDPPYMEIRSKRLENTRDADRPRAYTLKENIPPDRHPQKETAQVIQSEDVSYGLSLPLGEDYERKKHKLKEELRQDYRRYLTKGNAQAKRKKHLASTGEVNPATQGLSLPIGERLSGKERLRHERNREYNQFLTMKADEQETYRLAAAEKYNQNKTQSRLKAEQYKEAPVSHRDQDLPKKDAYTSMEAYEQLLNKRRAETRRPRRQDVETETEDKFVRREEEDTTVSRKNPWRSEMHSDRTDRPRYVDEDYEAEGRRLRLNFATDSNEPLSYRGRYDGDVHDRRPIRYNPPPERVLPRRADVLEKLEYMPDEASYFQIERSDHRPFRDRRVREPPVDYEDDFREQSNRRPKTTLTKGRPKVEKPVQPTERSKSAKTKEENFSTGLVFGGSDKDEAQKRRKERYRQELMEQMVEQQRNKRLEKELELKVAATGAIDPEKQLNEEEPDRLRQFGAINRQQDMPDRNVPFRPGVLIDSEKTGRRVENKPVIEEKAPPERPRVAFQTPVPEPAVTGSGYAVAYNPAQEDFHRGILSTLGEIVAPRIAAVPPPQPPVLVDHYRTPYDDAYYYYGARNPLDPNLAYCRRVENKPVIEEKAPPERPRVAFQTPVPEPAVTGSGYAVAYNPAQEDFHRGILSTLGEIVAPRIAAVPPPQPPVLVDHYRTPYDDAYYYYGARNPLDPNLAYYPVGTIGGQPAPGVGMPSMYPVPGHSQEHTVGYKQRAEAAKMASLGSFPEEKAHQNRQVAQSYQKDLDQQIRDRNEKRRKEKEEHERYESKLEAEMRSYNPWGKGGGGAPLKDEKGNLITDLKRMHKQNENASQNPELKAFEDKRAVVVVDTSLADHTSSTGKIPGFSFANQSQFARGSVFNEPPTEQQVHQQESYKNFLRQQIEEKRRKEEEEKEQIRMEDEREEKRVAEQRAKIQREYEEEQNRKKLKEEEQRQTNEELVRLADEKRKEAGRRKKEEEAKQEVELKHFYEEQKAADVTEEKEKSPRLPSPVIPTLRHKLTSRTPRPPTAESEVSIKSHDEPRTRTISPPVPARRTQLRAYEEKKNVITELTELRKQLRSEQRRLEGRLQDTDRDDESLPSRSGQRREKGSADIFELARQRLQATVRRPSLKGLENVNMQNIREFNDLKYRDTETREGVRFMFPDPPKDDQSLEIQQQALLREQQRNLNRMKRRPGIPDALEPFPAYSLHHTEALKDPTKDLLKTSLLESESAFIGENGEPYAAYTDPFSAARERRRHKQLTMDLDNDIPPVPPLRLTQPDTLSVNSASSFNVEELQIRNEERLRRLSNLRKSTVSIDPDGFGNADDILKGYTTKFSGRPQSVDTVATEPWMRPGTSETLKRFMAGQMNQETSTNENALTFNWQGLSTAHG
ncbi:PREDICTED: centrosome and spindle pole-associated protein 1 [Nanorana parkeri]|uniref:centrosome and spindle pole-associated protein 1 n=1 Tax=Nanorana parkeri TaxID=125878 RepID=UPI000854F12E|nr:PREDICTED: centrosome and spindle pole-associated protein 1 [Nanorana parkeri]